MEIFDISLTIYPEMVVYPGDPQPNFILQKTADDSNQFESTRLEILSHLGTHVDAMSHLYRSGLSIDKINLNRLTGNAIVADVSTPARMSLDYIKTFKNLTNSIFILKTGEGLKLEKGIFNESFLVPDRRISKYLISQNIKAIGIDTLSIDNQDEIENHPLFLKNNIPIIEGLYLEEVLPGEYFLVCLPLKLRNVDGSPARAILIKF